MLLRHSGTALLRGKVPFCLLVLAACGGARYRTELAPGATRIAAVHVEGNASIDDDTLVDGLALEHLRTTGQELEPYLIARDEERLRGVYLRRGFFRATVQSETQRRGDLAEVTFLIDEGPRARLAGVEITGLPDAPELRVETLRALIPLGDGAPFVYEVYDQAKPALLAAVERAGYAHAEIEATVIADRVRGEATIRLRVEAGPLAHFGPVTLHGVEGGLADAARARLTVREGERFSSAALVASQAALLDMGRFASVRVEPDCAAGAAIVPVVVTVVEAPRHELRLGGGVGMNPAFYEVRAPILGYSVAGWPWALTTTRVRIEPALTWQRDDDEREPRIEASATLERLDLFRPKIRAEVEAAYSYLAIEAYRSLGPRLRLGIRSPLYREIVGGSAGWQLRRLRFSEIDAAIDPALRDELGLSEEASYRLGFYEQKLWVDLRDDPVSPGEGLYAEVRVEEGTAAAAGAFDYVRVTPELRGFLPLPLGGMVLALRARGGAVFGDLPVTERYFAGGASSQRGFPERTLAPTATRVVNGAEVSVVYGGGALLELGAEVRWPLWRGDGWSLGVVGFLDGADVGEQIGDLDVGNLHWAAGSGVRIGTPIGVPIRIDMGFRLNRMGLGDLRPDEWWAWHLSVGEAF